MKWTKRIMAIILTMALIVVSWPVTYNAYNIDADVNGGNNSGAGDGNTGIDKGDFGGSGGGSGGGGSGGGTGGSGGDTGNGSAMAEKPSMDFKKGLAVFSSVGKAAMSAVGRMIYEKTYDSDHEFLNRIGKLMAGHDSAALIEIKFMLQDVMEELHLIQNEIGELGIEMEEGFKNLEILGLQSNYDAIVREYINPVNDATDESIARYIHLCYHLYAYTLELSDGGITEEEKEDLSLKLEEINGLKLRGWSTYEDEWNKNLILGNLSEEYIATEYAFRKCFENWAAATAEIDFADCMNKLDNAMNSYAGEKTLMEIREASLRKEYPFEHQIIDEMNQTMYYVTDLQARLLLLYSEYMDYQNTLTAEKVYASEKEAQIAVQIMNARVAKFEALAEEMAVIINRQAESAGITELMTLEENTVLTLRDGITIDVYRVKCNSDGRIYCIGKGKHPLSELVEVIRTGSDTGWGELTYYHSRMNSNDYRYQLVNFEQNGLGINSFFENKGSLNILTWLRENAGLKDVYGGSDLILTAKHEELPHRFSDVYDLYMLNIHTYNHKVSVDSQYEIIQSPFFIVGIDGISPSIDLPVREIEVSFSPDKKPVYYKDICYLPIYIDTHIISGDESGTLTVSQFSSIGDTTVLLDGDVLDLKQAYNDSVPKTIYVSGNVKVVGGSENVPIERVSFVLQPGANLTLENLYLSGADDERGAIMLAGEGEATITLVGTSKLMQGDAKNGCITPYDDESKMTLNLCGEKLILEAENGKCMEGITVKAQGVQIESSGKGSSEMVVNPGSFFQNCSIDSKSGGYDVINASYSGCTWTNYAPYKLIIQTGDIYNSQTTADLLLDIDGTSIKVTSNLEKNKTQTITVYGKALTSAQQKLKLKVDGSNDWYGISIQIFSNLSDYVTPDGRYMIVDWVDKKSQIEVENNNLGVYLEVTTANVKNAGTDSKISAALAWIDPETGGRKVSDYEDLSNYIKGNAFEKGNKDSVYIRLNNVPKDIPLENIQWIYLKSNMSNAAAGWKVSAISVTLMKAGVSSNTLTCNPEQWIVEKNYDYVFNLKEGASQQYKFTVETGTKKKSGTDAEISYCLVGTKGTTNWVASNDCITGNAYEKGDKNTFTLTFDKNVGQITEVHIKSNMKNAAAGWYCDSISISEYDAASSSSNSSINLDIQSWFENKEVQKFITPGVVTTGNTRVAPSSFRSVGTSGNTQTAVNGLSFNINPEEHWGIIKQIRIYRAETIDGTYTRFKVLENGETKVVDNEKKEVKHYYYKVFIEREDGSLLQLGRVIGIHAGALKDLLTKIELDMFTDEHISQELRAAGYTSMDKIKSDMQNIMFGLNEKITAETTELYNLDLYYFNGEAWKAADGSHWDKVEKLSFSIPVPEGSDPTQDTYYLLHMFGGNNIGEAGGIHQIKTKLYQAEDGEYYLEAQAKGFSPFMVGWVDASSDNIQTEIKMPNTGDNSSISIYMGFFILSSMITIILMEQRRRGKRVGK